MSKKDDKRIRDLTEAALNLGMSDADARHYAAAALRREQMEILDSQHGFDPMALGYYVPPRQ